MKLGLSIFIVSFDIVVQGLENESYTYRSLTLSCKYRAFNAGSSAVLHYIITMLIGLRYTENTIKSKISERKKSQRNIIDTSVSR